MYSEIKVNSKVQVDQESENPVLRSLRGIVIKVMLDHLVIVTDFGELIEVNFNDILNITKINFDRITSEAMNEIKGYYVNIYETELKLAELNKMKDEMKLKLYDAIFLSKFNIEGAKNRLLSTIPVELLKFEKEGLFYNSIIKLNTEKEIEINISVSQNIEYPDLMQTGPVDRIIRTYAPDEFERIQCTFNCKYNLNIVDKKLLHIEKDIYRVSVTYSIILPVTEKNLQATRQELINGLNQIRGKMGV